MPGTGHKMWVNPTSFRPSPAHLPPLIEKIRDTHLEELIGQDFVELPKVVAAWQRTIQHDDRFTHATGCAITWVHQQSIGDRSHLVVDPAPGLVGLVLVLVKL